MSGLSHILLLLLSFTWTWYIAAGSLIPVQLNVGVPEIVPAGERFEAICSWKQNTVTVAVHVPVESVMEKT